MRINTLKTCLIKNQKLDTLNGSLKHEKQSIIRIGLIFNTFFLKLKPTSNSFLLVNFHWILTWKRWFWHIHSDFHVKKWPKFTIFWRKENPKSPDFYDKFKVGSWEDRRIHFIFFLLSYVICNQIWLKYFWMISILATSQNL